MEKTMNQNILIASDSFKGSLSSQEIGDVFQHFFNNVHVIPLADGGEGSLDALKISNANLKKHYFEGMNTYGEVMKQHYFIDEQTAYIETASICGIDDRQDILRSTSQGIGLALSDAFAQGIKQIYVFLGGTGSNDAGMGLMAALGYQFLDSNGELLAAITENLNHVDSIISPSNGVDFFKIYLISDVVNELTGPMGTSYVFGPQKGAKASNIEEIEKGVSNFANVVSKHFNRDYRSSQSSGAAGGIPFAIMNCFNYEVFSGIDFISKKMGLEAAIKKSDIVISGEGRIDQQSFFGKTIQHVIALCQKYEKPYVLICGKNEMNHYYDPLCIGIFEMMDVALSFEESMTQGKTVLSRLIKLQVEEKIRQKAQ